MVTTTHHAGRYFGGATLIGGAARLAEPVSMELVFELTSQSLASSSLAGTADMTLVFDVTASGYAVAELSSDIELFFDMQSSLFVDVPVAAPPAGVESALIKRVSPTMPDPVLVDGRPS